MLDEHEHGKRGGAEPAVIETNAAVAPPPTPPTRLPFPPPDGTSGDSPPDQGFQSGLGIRKALRKHWGETVKLWDDLSEKVVRGHALSAAASPPAEGAAEACEPHDPPHADTPSASAQGSSTSGADAAAEAGAQGAPAEPPEAPGAHGNPWSPVVRPLSRAIMGARDMGGKLADIWDMHDLVEDVKQQRDYWRRRQEEKKSQEAAKRAAEWAKKEKAAEADAASATVAHGGDAAAQHQDAAALSLNCEEDHPSCAVGIGVASASHTEALADCESERSRPGAKAENDGGPSEVGTNSEGNGGRTASAASSPARSLLMAPTPEPCSKRGRRRVRSCFGGKENSEPVAVAEGTDAVDSLPVAAETPAHGLDDGRVWSAPVAVSAAAAGVAPIVVHARAAQRDLGDSPGSDTGIMIL